MIETVARSFAHAYVLWGFLMVAAAAFYGLHAAVLVTLAIRRWWGSRELGRGARLAIEIIYGLFNPLFYLTAITAAVQSPPTALDRWLNVAATVVLAAIWLPRLLLPRDAEWSPAVRATLSRLCEIGITCVITMGIRDLLRANLQFGNGVTGSGLSLAWSAIALAPLYLIPIMLLMDLRRRLRRPHEPAGFLLLPTRASVTALTVAMIAVAVPVGVAAYRPPSDRTREKVEALQPIIMDAAERYQVDPLLLAGIVFVTHAEHIKPLRDKAERFAAEMLVLDHGSHGGAARWFDISIGVAQIKPVTALTALKICERVTKWDKEYRDTPALGTEWTLGDPGERCAPPLAGRPGKQEVIAALLTDEGNLAFAAYILALYERQWRDANPAWSIDDRPEILATLYQIGFEKSRPHASPRSNAFGDRVAAVAREPWLRELFVF